MGFDELLAYAGRGQNQIASGGGWVGMPVVDDRWWDAGVVALGSVRPIEFALGVTQGAPGWPEPGSEDTPGKKLTDFHESLAMADLELQGGRAELHSEAFVKSWDTITTGTLRLHGGYVETRVGLGAITWLAARAEVMRFSDVTPSAGPARPWDDPLDRYELGAGLRASREVNLKLSVQRDVKRRPGQPIENADALSLAASIKF